jgi:hypothetical protein
MDTLATESLFGGISEVRLPSCEFDFGGGVSISPAEAHLMRPYLMTYRRPESSFPAIMSSKGSFGFDIVGEICIPASFDTDEWFDQPNSVWWLAALIRLRATPMLRVPVLSNASFATIALNKGQSFWPVEVEAERRRLVLDPDAPSEVKDDDLVWVRNHWRSGGRLMRETREFNVLFQAFDQTSFSRDPLLALLLMWSALEGMFSPARTELRFRIAANIATFLEPPGEGRALLQKSCAKLYDARSAAAHGRPEAATEPLVATYALLRRVLIKILESNEVPSPAAMEEALLYGR